MHDFAEYIVSPFVLRAMVALVLVALNAAFSGAFAGFRNSTFLISGASHAALGGAALVIVLESRGLSGGIDPLYGAALFAVALSLIAGNAGSRGGKSDVDTAIGVGFAFAMAVAVLLISLVPESASRVWGLLMGDLLLVTDGELWVLGGMTALVVTTFAAFRTEFLFVTFDMDGATAFGVPAKAYNYLLFALIGLSSAVLVETVGAILVFAMLSAPAATALLVSGSVGRTLRLSFLIALGAGLFGIVGSYFTDLSVSALAALFVAAGYFAVRVLRRP